MSEREPRIELGSADAVPDAVLDELRLAFEGGEAGPDAGTGRRIVIGDLDSRLTDPADSTGPWSPVLPAHATAAAAPPAEAAVPAAAAAGKARATIVIGDDDLPDPVYLDDEAEERLRAVHGGPVGAPPAPSGDDSGSSTILIGDDLDSTGMFDAIEPPSRSAEPGSRLRRQNAKRAANRKKLIWAGAVVLVFLVVVAVLAVFSSALFAVEHITTTGAVYTDPARLEAVQQEIQGQPILLLDTHKYELELEQIPWVERAIVHTSFPHGVTIDIRERQPLASFQGTDGKFRVVDREGRVLDVLDGQPIAYPLIAGTGPDAEPGSSAGAAYARAAQIGSALPGEVRSLLVNLTVDPSTGDLGMVLQPNITVRIGAFADIDGKLARLVQLMHQKNGLLGMVAIDVSTSQLSFTRG